MTRSRASQVSSDRIASIGDLARDMGLSTRTLRYWEELGILPEPPRSAGGSRRYPPSYRKHVETALELKSAGFPLEDIAPLAAVLGGETSAETRAVAASLVEDRLAELGRQVAVLARLRAIVSNGQGGA